jgi:hypothetical protein
MKHLYSLRGALLALLLGSGLAANAQTATALTCNGTSAYAQTTLTSVTGTAVSLECWVKVAAFKTAAGGISGVIGMESGYDAALLRFGDAGITSDKLQLVLGIAGDHQKLTSTTSLSPNTWYHVAGTFDGTTMRLYINGVLNNSMAMPGSVLGSGAFSIGRDYDNTRILNGVVDEVRVWTRTLTAAEIAANACAVSPTAAGLAGYWKLDDGTGTIAADASGKNHPGTLIGTTNANWTTAIPTTCAAPLAARPASLTEGLRVQVLGNPAPGATAELEISGAQGQPTSVQLLSLLGAVVQQQELAPAATRTTLPLPAAAGLYIVRVSTPTGSATTKLLRH